MSTLQPTLFEGVRNNMRDSIRLALASLENYGSTSRHWCIAWSGGKDSTAVLTFVVWAIVIGVPIEQASRGVVVGRGDLSTSSPLWRGVDESTAPTLPGMS